MLNFVENLNYDFEQYRQSLKPGQKATNEGIKRYFRDVLGWIKEDIELLR